MEKTNKKIAVCNPMPYKLDLKNYYAPPSVREACDILASEENSMPIAGGTGIYIFSNKGMMSNVDTLVNLGKLNLSYVEMEKEKVRIGAMTRLSDMGAGVTNINMIDEAVLSIPKEVRHMGTLGGQIFTAFPAFDLSVCLLALNGSISVTDGYKDRKIEMSRAYSAMFDPAIPEGSIIESVEAPSSYFNRTTYQKFSYTKHGFSDVSLALAVRISGDVLEDISMAVGGGSLDSEPVKLTQVEDSLKGTEVDQELIEKGLEGITNSSLLKFYSDHKSSSEYRQRMVGTMFKRGMEKLVGGVATHV